MAVNPFSTAVITGLVALASYVLTQTVLGREADQFEALIFFVVFALVFGLLAFLGKRNR